MRQLFYTSLFDGHAWEVVYDSSMHNTADERKKKAANFAADFVDRKTLKVSNEHMIVPICSLIALVNIFFPRIVSKHCSDSNDLMETRVNADSHTTLGRDRLGRFVY
ncbi:unnamed protein product [Ixodes pacificus]